MRGNVNKHRAVFVKISHYRSHLKKEKKIVKKTAKKDKNLPKAAKKIDVNVKSCQKNYNAR